ncbi:hypothetical protein BY996DRAFT_6418687 [Phakopsora pachyrhizi]|nr:hypothetical protein BY996DRAFT_6418687 [Phakopsora pachyrhizi]
MFIYPSYAVRFSYKLPAFLLLFNLAIVKASESHLTNLGNEIEKISLSVILSINLENCLNNFPAGSKFVTANKSFTPYIDGTGAPGSPEESVLALASQSERSPPRFLSHNIELKEQQAGTSTEAEKKIEQEIHEEKAFVMSSSPLSKIFESVNHQLQANNEILYQELVEIFKQFAAEIQPGDEISSFPDIQLMLEMINLIQSYNMQIKPTIDPLFSNKETLKTLIWYTSTILIKKWGFIGLFQSFDIKDFLVNHPDLIHVKALLSSLSDEQWEKIGIGFLKAHLDKRFNPTIISETHDKLIENFGGEINLFEKSSEADFQIPKKFNFEMDNKPNLPTKFSEASSSTNLVTQFLSEMNKLMPKTNNHWKPLPEIENVVPMVREFFEIEHLMNIWENGIKKNEQLQLLYNSKGFEDLRLITSEFQRFGNK